jgi:hypothetical protein
MTIKSQFTNQMIKYSVALILFLLVSLINVDQACDAPAKEKGIYTVDLTHIADGLNESDPSTDDSVGSLDDITKSNSAANNIFSAHVKPTSYLVQSYIRPLTRAPPQSRI